MIYDLKLFETLIFVDSGPQDYVTLNKLVY